MIPVSFSSAMVQYIKISIDHYHVEKDFKFDPVDIFG